MLKHKSISFIFKICQHRQENAFISNGQILPDLNICNFCRSELINEINRDY